MYMNGGTVKCSSSLYNIPTLMGYGIVDDKLPIEFRRLAVKLMQTLAVDV